MKVNILDAHDRYKHFTKHEFNISECCQNMIDSRPFGNHPFYIFAHSRTLGLDEKFKLFTAGLYHSMEEVPEKTLIWQPRLTKPQAQENSMLFKAYPGTDIIKIIWMIPSRELWDQYTKEKMMENETICNSIHDFQFNRKKLEEKEDDDMTEEQINSIYKEISFNARKEKSKKSKTESPTSP